MFEGEYLNGERNGKGKEYNHDDTLKFEGEYLNGKKKEYNNEESKQEHSNIKKIHAKYFK